VFNEALEGFNKYEPELWMPTISIDISDFIRMPLQLIVGFTLAATILTKLVPAFEPMFSLSGDLHGILGGCLAFIIVFRTNSSYDRWWEARKSLGNCTQLCRTLAAQTSPMLRDDACCRELISAIMSFSLALMANLREEEIQEAQLGPLLDWKEVKKFNDAPNKSLVAINRLFYIVAHSLPLHKFSGHSLGAVVFNQANEDLQALITEVSICERIRDTPMVFSYVSTLRTFLMLFLFSLPMVLVGWASG